VDEEEEGKTNDVDSSERILGLFWQSAWPQCLTGRRPAGGSVCCSEPAEQR